MEKIKYCPNCQKEHSVDDTKCSCGYEFVIKEEVDETVSTNTTVIVDNVPDFVWKLVSIFCPIAGLVLYIVWRQKWPERVKILGKFSLGMGIFYTLAIIFTIFVLIGLKTGDVV